MKFFIICLLQTSMAFASTNQIVFLKGKAWVNGKSTKVKQAIQFGDIVKTGKDSMAILKVAPGATLKLKENTELKVLKPKVKNNKNSQSFILKAGEFFIDAKRTRTNRYSVKANNAIFGVRGTQFFVSTIKDNQVWMCVNKGTVAVRTNKTKKEVLVNAGEGVVVNSPNLPQVKQYEWTKSLNWKMSGNYDQVKDTTIIDDINYNINEFEYE